MNEFAQDDLFQREKREKYLLPWYGKFAEVTLVDFDKEFQRLGIDTILVNKKTRRVTNVEEKIVRWPGHEYDAFALETHSCTLTGLESPGWMVYGKADRLLYCFAQELDALNCYWIDFKSLQEWFWLNEDVFNVFRMSSKNRTKGRVVPIDMVRENVKTVSFKLG